MSARDAAMSFITQQVPRWPDLGLNQIGVAESAERDAPLARAIVSETHRRWLTLEGLLAARLSQPLSGIEPKLRAALLVGAAQIFFMESQPDHAVVSDAVAWASRRIRRGAGGMVNAVLRKMIGLRGQIVNRPAPDGRDALPLSDGRWIELTENALPDEPVERLAMQTSHPVELMRRWVARCGPAGAERLALHSLVVAPTIVTGLSAAAIGEHEHLAPHDEPGFALWNGSHGGLVDLLAAHPEARVQDPASHDIVRIIRESVDTPRLIVDACAGSGTKTAHLAEAFPEASIIAADVDSRRYALMRERFAASPRVQVVAHDRLIEWAGRADLLLLDVPCTNTGTLARRLEAKYRVDAAHLDSLLALQRQIVADHLALRAPDGLVAYSTCSLEPEENEQQARWICRWHDLRILREHSRSPSGLPGDGPGRYADGAYLALIR